jgi:peptide/nickel transport system ATP-binding protein
MKPERTLPRPADAIIGPLVEVRGLTKNFVSRLDWLGRLFRRLTGRSTQVVVHAVDHVDLAILPGEIVGLVGESGSGKSTIARMMAGLLEPTGGEISYQGRGQALQPGHKANLAIQMIFQDPFASLSPRMRVRDIIGDAPLAHGMISRRELTAYVADFMKRVGLDPASMNRYPHQFSGGQRQRIGIARALAVRPELLVCDEVVSALDVSIQAQILNLFMELRESFSLTYLFVTHDLAVVSHIADRIAVMYLGRIVEIAPVREFFESPNHPYAQALLAVSPHLEKAGGLSAPLEGEIPSAITPPRGCHFHPRCRFAFARCREEKPELKTIAPGRMSACHLNG